jgi:prepilin peptidase CpaA
VTDVQSYRIPNKVNGAMLLLFVVTRAAFIMDLPVQDSLLAFAVTFAVGYFIFIFKIMGGGDVKMLSVLVLWVGWGEPFLSYILMVAFIGGVATIALVIGRIVAPFIALKLGRDASVIPKLFTQGAPVPYGIAIGCVFLWMLWNGNFPHFVLR